MKGDPEVIDVLAGECDLSPVVDRIVPWEEAPQAWSDMAGKTVFVRD